MMVSVVKTGERRYGVLVQRERFPELAIDPAPGYHAYLPHDLLHFVAEAEWKLDGAVFGQLAAGGDAGPRVRKLGRSGSAAVGRYGAVLGQPAGRRPEVIAVRCVR